MANHVYHLNMMRTNHISRTADRLRRCQLSSRVIVIHKFLMVVGQLLITPTVETCIQQLDRVEEMV